MRRIKPDVDVIMDVLKAVIGERPDSAFAQSLLRQYQERGGLSKKQLEGLLAKGRKVKSLAPARLATLEAIILKKKSKERSAPPPPEPLYKRDEETGGLIAALLAKYPEHKRVLFLKSKYDNNEPLLAAELADLKRFEKLLK